MAFEAEILNDGAPADDLGGQPAALDLDAIDGLARPASVPKTSRFNISAITTVQIHIYD